MARQDLWSLIPVVKACCSDDETDYEDDQSQKICKIRRLPWRNPLLDQIFDTIDEARGQQNLVKTSPGSHPRVRKRHPDNPYSKKPPPPKLNVDCYCPVWLDSKPGLRETLEVIEKPILQSVKHQLAKYVRNPWSTFLSHSLAHHTLFPDICLFLSFLFAFHRQNNLDVT